MICFLVYILSIYNFKYNFTFLYVTSYYFVLIDDLKQMLFISEFKLCYDYLYGYNLVLHTKIWNCSVSKLYCITDVL